LILTNKAIRQAASVAVAVAAVASAAVVVVVDNVSFG